MHANRTVKCSNISNSTHIHHALHRSGRNLWVEQEEMNAQMAKEARSEAHEERKGERNEMYEQMRAKYGLHESSQALGGKGV